MIDASFRVLDLQTLKALRLETYTTLAGKPTTRVRLGVNLDVRQQAPSQEFDYREPATTSNFPASIVVFDSLSKGHQVTVYFARLGPTVWG